MHRRAYIIWLVTAVFACEGRSASNAGDTVGTPAGDQRGSDVRAEEQALRALRQRHSDAIASKDADFVVSVYAEDVVYLPDGEKPQEGRGAALESWSNGFKAAGLKLEYRPEDFRVAESGDLAYERGKVWSNDPAKPGSEMKESGNYLYGWKKEGGQWKVGLWMWNWYEQS